MLFCFVFMYGWRREGGGEGGDGLAKMDTHPGTGYTRILAQVETEKSIRLFKHTDNKNKSTVAPPPPQKKKEKKKKKKKKKGKRKKKDTKRKTTAPVVTE